jgi:serine/threonine-protein kinase
MEVTPSVRLVSPLAAGGMGAVWLADHTALRTRVVVKFLLGGLDASSSARARFKREAEAASQVKSPHVVQTFDSGVTPDGLPFIVMEHLEGRDLGAELAARGALPPAMVVTVVAQVAKALTKAHAAGLLHRDIKPENIFLCQSEPDDELFVKLLDFGIAKAFVAGGEADLDGQTKTGQVVGTPFYMSPEQVTAQRSVDARSDLWALGVVAFQALTGARPFDGPSFGALAVTIATGPCPRPSDANPELPPAVDAWFAQACAREPSARFASARELADRLRAAFEGFVSLPLLASGTADSGALVAVDEAARRRSAFVLASTIDPHATGEEPALTGTGDRDAARAKKKALLPLAALVAVTLAVAVGWQAKGRAPAGDAGEGRTSRASEGPLAAIPSSPASAAAPAAAAARDASAVVALDPVQTAVASSSASPASFDASAPTLRAAASGRPAASASSLRPSTSAIGPLPSARPTTTAYDPLY